MSANLAVDTDWGKYSQVQANPAKSPAIPITNAPTSTEDLRLDDFGEPLWQIDEAVLATFVIGNPCNIDVVIN